LPARLLNILVAPGEAFDSIKGAADQAANWVVPALLLILAGWLGAWLIFSQDSINQQLRDITNKAIEKQIENAHMSEAQAEQTRRVGEKWAGISTKIGSYASPLVGALATPFIWGLFLWLAGAKAMKARLPYMKAVEVAGLANMVAVLDTVVRVLLILLTGNIFASLSPVLLVKDYDPQNTAHSLLALANPMVLWLLGVRSIGLARLAGASFARAAAWVFGIWAGYTAFFIALGLGAKALFQK
jgi:hypothetical protein